MKKKYNWELLVGVKMLLLIAISGFLYPSARKTQLNWAFFLDITLDLINTLPLTITSPFRNPREYPKM